MDTPRPYYLRYVTAKGDWRYLGWWKTMNDVARHVEIYMPDLDEFSVLRRHSEGEYEHVKLVDGLGND